MLKQSPDRYITVALIRELDFWNEAEAFVALRQQLVAETPSAEVAREIEARCSPSSHRLRFVDVDEDGHFQGYAVAVHHDTFSPGVFHFSIGVDPAARRRGIGGGLYEVCSSRAKELGATILWGEIQEHWLDGKVFCEKRGGKQYSYDFASVLDLNSYVVTPPNWSDDRVQLVEFEGAQATENQVAELFDFLSTTELDEPSSEMRGRTPFEIFEMKLKDEKYRESVLVIARDSECIVGMCWITPYGGTHYNDFTSVAAAYRGRGIATALKIQATNLAKERGFKSISAHNASNNPAMVSINKKMGYVSKPGVYSYQIKV